MNELNLITSVTLETFRNRQSFIIAFFKYQ